jgi:hypothetical protein
MYFSLDQAKDEDSSAPAQAPWLDFINHTTSISFEPLRYREILAKPDPPVVL